MRFLICRIVVFVLCIMGLAACDRSFLPRQRPACPEVPVYPNAVKTDFRYDEVIARTTTYRVPATGQQVLDFYRSALLRADWILREETPSRTFWMFENDADQPPFGLGILVTELGENQAELEIRHIIYGPFQWSPYCTSPYP